MMGCYVYFMNKDTENYFRSLIQTSSGSKPASSLN